MKIKLNPCKKCGSKAKIRASCGGSTIYYGIYCECGNNNRKFNSSIYSYGLGRSGGFPPTNKKIAIEKWNESNNL